MIVLKFGVRKITGGATYAHAEMRTAHYLYNALVAVERWKRREFATIRSRYVPGLAEIEDAYEQLSDWIGEHAGRDGSERGGIREKRQKASAPKEPNGKPHPTKQVDDDKEKSIIAQMKTWRSAASAVAKPLRDAFEALVKPAKEEYQRRTSVGPEGDNHAKKRLNASVRIEMLDEPWHDAWKGVARLEAAAYELRSWIGDAHNLNHGTYTAVADDLVRAGKRPPPRPDGEPRKPKQRPAFSRRGLRKMGWQIQGGVAWSDVLAGKCRDLKIDDMRPQGGSGHRWRATMRIRISQPDRTNEWVTLNVAVHRPVPDDTHITWVYLVPEERPGDRWEYSVQLTATPSEPLIRRAPGTGHAHVSLRWTQHGDTLEVADVNGVPLLLPGGPRGIVAKLRFAESLRGFSDKHFDSARTELSKRLDGMPDDVRAMCANISHWKRHEQLRHVSNVLATTMPEGRALETWYAWRDHRLAKRLDLFVPLSEFWEWAGGDVFACWLETWRHKDEHLERMAEGTRRGAIGARRDFYRVTAARLSERFATYSLGGAVDLAALALRDKSEDRPEELHQAARHNRTLAAVSELKEAIKYAFGPDRMREQSGDAEPPEGTRDGEKHAGSVASDTAAE